QKSFENIPERIRQKLKIYNGFHPIIWPDLKANREFYQTKQWPSDYLMAYGSKWGNDSYELESIARNDQNTDQTVASCTILHGLVSRDAFFDYNQNVRKFADAIRDKTVGPVIEPITAEGVDLYSGANFTSYEAMRYFGSQNWPDDFLVKFGQYATNDCAGVAGLGISVLPRKLFTLVAVVEATGKRLKLGGFGYNVDRAQGLRTNLNPNEQATEEFEFPAMNRGDTVVVPLRVELRYDLDGNFLSLVRANRKATRYRRMIQSLQRPIQVGDSTVIKPLESFREPQFSNIERTYYFGEVRDLTQVLIAGNAYEVRKTPRFAVLSIAGFDGASCPFLEFVEEDGEPSLYGRVLVGASNQSKSMTETVKVPAKAKSIIISEREPEISYLQRIELVSKTDEKRHTMAENVVLKPWEKLELKIPEKLRDQELEIEITGYYELLKPELLSQMSTGRNQPQ
ncbi:MAG: hypothetical protein AAF412_02065, partial [Pseudomonadota bacterium]